MKKTIDAVVAGHICLDIIPGMPETGARGCADIFVPGKLINVGKAEISTGGAVSNTGLALRRMGFEVELAAKIGGDMFGGSVSAIMKSAGAGRGLAVAEGEETSYTIVIAPPGIDRIFLHNPGANRAFGFSDIKWELVEKSRLFHLGYPPLLEKIYSGEGGELSRIFKEAKKRCAATSLDMSLPDPASPSGRVPWRSLLENVLPSVDIFLPGAEEAFFMLHREKFMDIRENSAGAPLLDILDPRDISGVGAELVSMGAGIAGIKCGHRGLYLRTSDRERFEGFGALKPADCAGWAGRELWMPPFSIKKFVSALGAGDTAVAGFLAAMLKGMGAERALEHAAACGAQAVMSADAVSGVRTWEETAGMVSDGWKKEEIELPAGWAKTPGGLFLGPGDSARGGRTA